MLHAIANSQFRIKRNPALRLLLESAANVNAQDSYGQTTLFMFIKTRQPVDDIKLLLEFKVGTSSLHLLTVVIMNAQADMKAAEAGQESLLRVAVEASDPK